MRIRALYGFVGGVGVVSLVGCGARTPLPEFGATPDAAADVHDEPQVDSPPPKECTKPADCDGFDDKCNPITCDTTTNKCKALAPVTCDDKDPCTDDQCDSTTGTCGFTALTFDNDHDGHKGPLPGYGPGSPGACGDDCDDTSAAAYPGAKEICDGVDNDCNGVVDDNAEFVPAGGVEAVRVDGDVAPAGPGGLAWSGGETFGYLSSYWGTENQKTRILNQRLSASGDKLGDVQQVTLINADAGGGPLAWTGDRYGIVWNDRRNGDYEVYFNRLGPDGAKLGPDVRVTDAWGFSVNAQIAFNGSYFIVVWQDDRDGTFNVYGQRIDLEGNLVGDNIQITSEWMSSSEAPTVAVGTHGIGIAWAYGDAESHQVRFQTFTPALDPIGTPIDLTKSGAGVFPSVVWNKKSYVIAWFDTDYEPHAVYGAVVDETPSVLASATLLTSSPKHTRYPSLLPLGDRLLMVFSDDRDNNQGYELYARMLTSSLGFLSPELRVTNATGDSVYPTAAFGPKGDVGILFRDDRTLSQHVYFTRLQCVSVQ